MSPKHNMKVLKRTLKKKTKDDHKQPLHGQKGKNAPMDVDDTDDQNGAPMDVQDTAHVQKKPAKDDRSNQSIDTILSKMTPLQKKNGTTPLKYFQIVFFVILL